STPFIPYDAYEFQNTTDRPACVSIDVETPCSLFSPTAVVYLGSFNRFDPTINYLADNGGLRNRSFSFEAPSRSHLALVFSGSVVGVGCDRYNFQVGGLPCADLQVTRNGGDAPITQGQPLTYGISVFNNGPNAA